MTPPAMKIEQLRSHKEFFDYINERYEIYLRRTVQGKKPPWTKDPILRSWSFTNTWRQLDRGTIFLHDYLLKPHASAPREEILFNIVFHREFNRWQTSAQVGWIKKWDPTGYKKMITKMNEVEPVFTSAHIVRSADGRKKIDSVIEILTNIWDDRKHLIKVCDETRSMEEVFKEICRYPYLGQFMAYQFVLDMVDTKVLDFAEDKLQWACVGPGALRGLRWLFNGVTMSTGLARMHELLAESPKYLSKNVKNGPYPFTIHEIEFSLCEFSKLCKLRYVPGGKSRVRFDERKYNPGFKQ